MARARRTANWLQYLSDRVAFRSYRRRRPRFQEPFSGFCGRGLVEGKKGRKRLSAANSRPFISSGVGNALIKTFLRIYFHFVWDWILWISGDIRKLSLNRLGERYIWRKLLVSGINVLSTACESRGGMNVGN